jgi:plastocyanin
MEYDPMCGFAPAKWTPQVGEKVWWDGVSTMASGHNAQMVKILTYNQDAYWPVWEIKRDDGGLSTATIDHLRPLEQAPKPEHYPGEPCNLPVWELNSPDKRAESKALRFEYTGEYRPIPDSKHEWSVFESSYGPVISWGWDGSNAAWILRAVPVEPPKPECCPHCGARIERCK